MSAAPTPATDEIRRALSTLFAPTDVIELRAIHKGRKRIDAGYFDAEHRDALVESSAKLNSSGAAVYVTLNPLDPQLLARCANRVQEFAQATATDTNVTRRCWLLVDIDPQRPKDTSSTDSQYELARTRGRAIYAYLAERGWPQPAVAHSGNGVHLLYRVDLPNDDESRDLVKHALEALASRFDDDAVKVDRSVFNAARIIKLHGTVATKGDHVPGAPWRLSRLLKVPSPIQPVSSELLKGLAAESQPTQAPTTTREPSSLKAWGEAEVVAFLGRGGIEAIGPEPHDGALRWKLKVCPFNPDHGPGESAVFLRPDGRLGFDCKHNSCTDKHWRDLRTLVDGERSPRTTSGPRTGPVNGQSAGRPDDGFGWLRDIPRNPPIPQPEEPRQWPEPLAQAAFQGLIGDIVRAVEPQTESDPAAVLLQVLISYGALVGRGPHVRVEGDEHHLNLFGLIAGDTSKARKGTSWSRVREIFSQLHATKENFRDATYWPRVVNGLSSGEGLKYNVRDARTELKQNKSGEKEEVLSDAGVEDKRLLVVESEFAQVLRQGARAGNTLSATIRAAWDTGDLMTLTKNDPVTATGAHISIIGHITIDELRAELTATDSANGFANRFLLMCVKRSKMLPFGGAPLSQETLRGLVARIEAAVNHARRQRAVTMTEAARTVWETVYPRLSEGCAGLLGAVTARAEAQCIRLSLAYALADEAPEIDARHLLAAIAVWERCEASARYVFGGALGDQVADEILRSLRIAGAAGMTRTEINDLFKGHQRTERIGAALQLLHERRLAEAHQRPGPGRSAEIWTCGISGKSGTRD